MNPGAQTRLDNILKKSPEELNTEEIAFLRARRDYLKTSQVEEYDSILNPKETKPLETETVKTHGKNNTK